MQTRDGVEEDDDILTALYHTLSLVQHDLGDLDVAVSRLVEGRSDDLGIDAGRHVR